jgi:hypothetical protein
MFANKYSDRNSKYILTDYILDISFGNEKSLVLI